MASRPIRELLLERLMDHVENDAGIEGATCPTCGRDNSDYGNVCTSDDCMAVLDRLAVQRATKGCAVVIQVGMTAAGHTAWVVLADDGRTNLHTAQSPHSHAAACAAARKWAEDNSHDVVAVRNLDAA